MLVSNMNLPFQGSISMLRGCRHRNSFAHLKQNEFDSESNVYSYHVFVY